MAKGIEDCIWGEQQLGILISGRGSNMQALVNAADNGDIPSVAVVISNIPNAAGLVWAKANGVPTEVISPADYPDRTAHDEAMAAKLKGYYVTTVCLAGYMRIVGTPLLAAYPNRILNIHPSLLPKFGGPGMVGQRVHQAVLDAGETESGCTVHVVTDEVDGGPIVARQSVPVDTQDDMDSLAQRVLQVEHACYPQAVRLFCSK